MKRDVILFSVNLNLTLLRASGNWSITRHFTICESDEKQADLQCQPWASQSEQKSPSQLNYGTVTLS